MLVLSHGHGFSGESLFPRALLGVASSVVLGIPLLLLGDRYWPQFKLRHLASGCMQSLVTCLLLGGFSWQWLASAVWGGVVLGIWYSLVIPWVEIWSRRASLPARRGWQAVLAIPLAGGLALGTAASIFFSAQADVLPAFILFFVIGALISMLVCWPMLWLVERYLVTPWRHVIGGAGSGLLIWLISIGPIFMVRPTLIFQGAVTLPPLFWLGPVVFVSIGVIAGLLYSAFVFALGRKKS